MKYTNNMTTNHLYELFALENLCASAGRPRPTGYERDDHCYKLTLRISLWNANFYTIYYTIPT